MVTVTVYGPSAPSRDRLWSTGLGPPASLPAPACRQGWRRSQASTAPSAWPTGDRPFAFADPVAGPRAAFAPALALAVSRTAPVPAAVRGDRCVALGPPEGTVALPAAHQVAHRPIAHRLAPI